MIKMAQKVAAGFVVYRKNNNKINYLLLQTSYGKHHWTPPKGHVDPGESDIETAYRETQEESGLLGCDLNVYENSKKSLNYMVNGKPKIVHYWLAELINSNAKVKLSEEHIDFKWLEIDEACKISQYKDMIELLKYFDDYLKKENSV